MRPHFQPSIPYTNGLSAHKSPRFLKSGTAICSLSKRVVFYNQPSLSAYHRHQPRYHGISQVFCLTKDITFLCVVNELPVMSEGENEVCARWAWGASRVRALRARGIVLSLAHASFLALSSILPLISGKRQNKPCASSTTKKVGHIMRI